MDVNLLSDEQIFALRCAYADLEWAEDSCYDESDCERIEKTKGELDRAFPGILDAHPYEFEDEDEDDEDDSWIVYDDDEEECDSESMYDEEDDE